MNGMSRLMWRILLLLPTGKNWQRLEALPSLRRRFRSMANMVNPVVIDCEKDL